MRSPRSRTRIGALLLLLLSAVGAAQGPVYRERWGYLHLELLRARVHQDLAARDADTIGKVAELLAAPDDGVPFRPPAQSLAMLRGVPCDAAFLFRATVGAFVLPEIVDPESDRPDCRDCNVSVFLPFPVPPAGEASFVVTALDRAGNEVFRTVLNQDTAIADLRMARPVAKVKTDGLPDGTYRVVVATQLGDQPPRQHDVVLQHDFHVQRGYQRRAEAAMAAARDRDAMLPPLHRALLRGLAAQVARAYAGEAFDGRSDAPMDLQRLEQALQNLAEERSPLHGLSGAVPTALPAGGGELGCVLRLPVAVEAPAVADPAQVGPAASLERRPLVVFASGAPSLDPLARRPSAPVARSARWLAAELAGFDPGGRYHVAFLDSAGGGGNYAEQLRDALAALRELLPVAGDKAVLVLDREAAMAATFRAQWLGEAAAGVVLIGAGAFQTVDLPRLQAMRLLLCPLAAHPSSQGLLRLRELLRDPKAGFIGVAESFDAVPVPWTVPWALLQERIHAFAAAAFVAPRSSR